MYKRYLRGLIPFLSVWILFYALIFCTLMFVVGSIGKALLGLYLLGGIPILLIFSIYRFVKFCLDVNYYEIADEGLTFVDRSNNRTFLLWKDILDMQFASGSFGLTLEFIGGKNFGYYQISDGKNNTIKIPPTVTNRDLLIQEIIQKANLIKNSPSIVTSLTGSFFTPQRAKGDFNYWTKNDGTTETNNLDVSPRQFSSLLDYLIVTVIFIVIMLVITSIFHYMQTGKWDFYIYIINGFKGGLSFS